MSVRAKNTPPILFFVSADEDGGYVAKAPKYGIYTQGETIDELIANMKEAVACHFDDEELPKNFAWHPCTT